MVLFQVGDFFEMFGEDAKAAADILDIHLIYEEVLRSTTLPTPQNGT